MTERQTGGVQELEVDWEGAVARSDTPALAAHSVFGAADGPGILLDRVVGVLPAGEGRWVIGQSQAPFLLLVSGEGILASAGRSGDGPGEFRRLDWVGPGPGGRIVAHSALDHTVAVFEADLAFREQLRLDPQPWIEMGYQGHFTMIGIPPDGSFVGAAVRPTGDGSVPLGWSRPERGMLAVARGGSVSEVRGALRGDELYGFDTDCPMPGGCRGFNNRPPLQKRTVVRLAGAEIYTMDTGEGVIEVRTLAGSEMRRLRFASTGAEPTPDQIERAVAAHMTTVNPGSTEARQRIEGNVRAHATPGPPPVLRNFVVGESGEVWVQLDPNVVPEAAELLLRVDLANPAATAYRVPGGFSLLGADARNLWGLVVDSLGVEYVYVLRRS